MKKANSKPHSGKFMCMQKTSELNIHVKIAENRKLDPKKVGNTEEN